MLSSLNATSPIGDIKFRDKRESGWKKFRFVVLKKSASKADQNTVLSSDIHYDNPFMQGFLSDIYLRPSCYECKCKNGVNHSDLTIGDYWAARVTDQDFDDDKGVGLVLVNTSKGKEYFDKLNMMVRKSDIDKANLCNGGFNEHTHAHPKRALFFALIYQGKTIKDAVDICLKISLFSRVKNKTKRLVKEVVKQVLGDKGVKVVKTAFRK